MYNAEDFAAKTLTEYRERVDVPCHIYDNIRLFELDFYGLARLYNLCTRPELRRNLLLIF